VAAWSYTNAARLQLKLQGTQVVSVHVGAVNTDMQAGTRPRRPRRRQSRPPTRQASCPPVNEPRRK
jgi:NAD(P)-dependent dehydrogenase (short-subunit alcohol dehydrogenase family)